MQLRLCKISRAYHTNNVKYDGIINEIFVFFHYQTSTMSSIKGPSSTHFDGSNLRIAIVHARWNKTVIDALLAGTISKLKECGVKDSNIIIQSVPGSFELPFACSK